MIFEHFSGGISDRQLRSRPGACSSRGGYGDAPFACQGYDRAKSVCDSSRLADAKHFTALAR
jgi:hypothetical protein